MASHPRSALDFAAVLRSSRLVDDETLREMLAQVGRRASERVAQASERVAQEVADAPSQAAAYDAPLNASSTQVGPRSSSSKTLVDPNDSSSETFYPRSLPDPRAGAAALRSVLATDDLPEERRRGDDSAKSGSDQTGSDKTGSSKTGSSKNRSGKAQPPLEPGDPTARDLAELLVQRDLITPWQREQLEAGRPERIWLGKCRLMSLLARGGMSNLFLATHVGVQRLVVVKVLPASKAKEGSFRERFIAEAEASARLNHPNVIRVLSFDRDVDRNLYYMVFEYVAGLDLQRWVAERGPLDCEQAADFIAQAADGLAHAHERGVIHRDVKPGNLLVDASGKVKILDFGLARQRSRKNSITLEHHDKILGTVDYLAPEQAMDSHHVEPRVDQYSLGCTLFFAITGRPPFQAASMTERLLQHAYDAPPLLSEIRSDVPSPLAAVCLKLLAKRPEDRYADASEAAWALRSCFPKLAARYAAASGCVIAAEAAAPRATGGSSTGSTILSTWQQEGQPGPPLPGLPREEGSGIGATDDPLRARPSNTSVCGSSGTVMLGGEEWSPADVVEEHDHGVAHLEIDLQHLPAAGVGLGDASSSGSGFAPPHAVAAVASTPAAPSSAGPAAGKTGRSEKDAFAGLQDLVDRSVPAVGADASAFEPSSMSLMEAPTPSGVDLQSGRALGAGVGDDSREGAARSLYGRRVRRSGRSGEPREVAKGRPTPPAEEPADQGKRGRRSVDDLPIGALLAQFDAPSGEEPHFDPNKTYIPDEESPTEVVEDVSGDASSVFLPPGAIALPAGPPVAAPPGAGKSPAAAKNASAAKSASSAKTPGPLAAPRPGLPAGPLPTDKTRISPLQPGSPMGPMDCDDTSISTPQPPGGMPTEKPSSEARTADFDSFKNQPTDMAKPAARQAGPKRDAAAQHPLKRHGRTGGDARPDSPAPRAAAHGPADPGTSPRRDGAHPARTSAPAASAPNAPERPRVAGEGSGEAARRLTGRPASPPQQTTPHPGALKPAAAVLARAAAGQARIAQQAAAVAPTVKVQPEPPRTAPKPAAAPGPAVAPHPAEDVRPSPEPKTVVAPQAKAAAAPAAERPLIDLAGAVGVHAPPASDVDSSLISSINFDVLRKDSAASDTGGATSTDVMTRPPAAERSRSRSAVRPAGAAPSRDWAATGKWIAVVVACSGISGLLGYWLGTTRPPTGAKVSVSNSFLEEEARRARAKFADPSVKWVPNTPKK